jgi:hypothetical protein
MPPKRAYLEKPATRRAPKGFLASTYETLTSADNAAVVRSVAIFGVSFHALCPAECSSWALSMLEA